MCLGALTIFPARFWFSGIFFHCLFVTVSSCLLLTGIFFYLNQHIDVPETLDYFVTEKFERTLRYGSDTAKSINSLRIILIYV